MKKETYLLIGILAVGGYLIWRTKKVKPAAASEKTEAPVEVEVVETKMNANASTTQPRFASSVFRKPWVVVQNQGNNFN